MRRALATFLLGWFVVVGFAPSATATDGGTDPDNPPPDSCFEVNADGDLPTCTYDGSQWQRSYPSTTDGIPGGFVAFAVLAVLVGVGFTVYKVSMARDMARQTGMDPDQATAMTLLTDDGLSATYLAANLRPPSGATPARQEPGPADGAVAGRTVSERLAELESLREKGQVTQAEYDERRAAILGSL